MTATISAWKLVSVALTSYQGFQWPLSGRVVADPDGSLFMMGDPCPAFPGDGLCLAKNVRGAQSGGLPLGRAVGVDVTYLPEHVLGESTDKLRVSECTVVGTFDPLKRFVVPGANLSGANLSGADLRGAYLYGADLEGANLSGANLYGANLRGANLHGADLHGADLRSANLHGADLHGANLCGADLEGADLEGANMQGANMQGANMQGAYLEGANLRGAYLYSANLEGARASAYTIWPDGFDPSAAGVEA